LSQQIAIRAERLRKTYRSGGAEILVFDELSLDVPKGQRLAIIGESGAGKSTLLHLLGGLDQPTSGAVICAGRNLSAISAGELAELRNRELGFVWQTPSLLPEFTALENVMMPLLIRGVHPKKAAETAGHRLDEVGLGARQSHRSGELSGGEQQRVAVARAIVGEPSVLLADEPTGSLDFRTGESLAALLRVLHDRHNLTSIFVTHNLSFAQSCDSVLELKKGALHPVQSAEREFPGIAEGAKSLLKRDATRLDGGLYV
jgi:lipoprotein-releasing system ATP-binding protein